jgi:hypothetical protein
MAGDWPQYFYALDLPGLRIREVSPFIPAFIHHSLTHVVESNREALGLTPDDIEAARSMRKRAVALVRRFESAPTAPDAGAFGFWPHRAATARNGLLADLALEWIEGPRLYGSCFPMNVPFYPVELGVPNECDSTAAAYVVMANDALCDGGPGAPRPVELLFAEWRDVGQIPRRLNPDWLPYASGAFLTWFNYHDPPIPNDIDVAVNANVLHCLARYGRLDTPGAAEAIDLINRVVLEGLHRTRQQEVSPYTQAGYVFHFIVTRAYADGPVPGLQPAAEILADEVEREAIALSENKVCWDRGARHLDTALCLLTLLQARRYDAAGDAGLLSKAVAYLVEEQDPLLGCWNDGAVFVARSESGKQFNWVSSSFTTAIALEALCHYLLSFDQEVPMESSRSLRRDGRAGQALGTWPREYSGNSGCYPL